MWIARLAGLWIAAAVLARFVMLGIAIGLAVMVITADQGSITLSWKMEETADE